MLISAHSARTQRPLRALSVPSQCPLSALSAHAVSVRASLLGPRSASACALSRKKIERARASTGRASSARRAHTVFDATGMCARAPPLMLRARAVL
ncbi:hypothetical protein GGX14DRAFT_570358 [Mycena pura]|uniref:Uncharacterized protein n=1 Tax=Mycena pura TaxID=153505 RepID=A0AAD6V4Z3_9AGAR|nr:hypothetical protein GGX14DRAFT_570358 [Mycena pura]